MCREMNEPTPTSALDDLVREQIREHFQLLESILTELAPELGEERLRLATMSTIAQCLHFRFARPVIDRMFRGRYDVSEIDLVADHISDFTIAALRGISPVPSRTGAGRATTRRTRRNKNTPDSQRRSRR